MVAGSVYTAFACLSFSRFSFLKTTMTLGAGVAPICIHKLWSHVSWLKYKESIIINSCGPTKSPLYTQQFPWALSEFPVSFYPLSRDIRQRWWYNPTMWQKSFDAYPFIFFFLEPSKGKVGNVTLVCSSLPLSQGAMISPQDLSVRLLCFNSSPLPVGLSGFRTTTGNKLWGWIWWGEAEPHVAWPHFLLKILGAKERYVIPNLDSESWHSSVRKQMSFPETAVRRGTPSDR